MKKYILISLVFIAASCQPINNDVVIREKDKCEKSGMDFEIIKDKYDNIMRVNCVKLDVHERTDDDRT